MACFEVTDRLPEYVRRGLFDLWRRGEMPFHELMVKLYPGAYTSDPKAAAELPVPKAEPVKTCAFCDSTEDLETCDWPEYRFVPSTYGKLRVGDKVKRISDKREGRAPAVVLKLDPYDDAWVYVTLQIGKRTKQIAVYQRSPVRVLRDDNCDQPCCALHRVERGPGATYCFTHRRSWEAIS